MEQARLGMVHAFQLEYKTEVAPILPYGIYTIPETSMAGESEVSMKEKGIDCVTGRASYGQNARGQIIGDFDGFLMDFDDLLMEFDQIPSKIHQNPSKGAQIGGSRGRQPPGDIW